jgi:hypothetical protein
VRQEIHGIGMSLLIALNLPAVHCHKLRGKQHHYHYHSSVCTGGLQVVPGKRGDGICKARAGHRGAGHRQYKDEVLTIVLNFLILLERHYGQYHYAEQYDRRQSLRKVCDRLAGVVEEGTYYPRLQLVHDGFPHLEKEEDTRQCQYGDPSVHEKK